jgi:outer membrane receptor for ferrienterochelin and colicin
MTKRKKSLLFILLLVSQRSFSEISPDKDNLFLNMSLDSLLDLEVRSPSRKRESQRETASSIFVVDRKQILAMGARNLRDVMRVVPGVQSVNNSDEQLISIRGIFADSGTKLLVMIDGHEVNRMQDQGSSSEIPNMFIEKIERVEVIRGPGAVIYGASAFSGILNVITREPDEEGGSHARLSAGSFDQYKAETVLDKKIAEDVNAYLYAGLATSNGDHVPISGDEFTSETPSKTNIEGLKAPALELYSRIQSKNLELKMRYLDINEEIPAKAGLARHYKSGFLETSHRGVKIGENIEFKPRVFVDAVELERDNVYKAGEVRVGTELRFTHDATDKTHSSIGGLEYRHDHFGDLPFSHKNSTDSFGGNTTSLPSLRSSNVDLENIGVFFQHDHFLSDTFKVTGGARFDDRSLASNYTTPRFGMVWLPEKDRTIKLLFQSATLPLPIENRGPSAIKSSSDDLLNEKIQSYELIWSEGIKFGVLETSLFVNRIRDMIFIRLNDTTLPPQDGLANNQLFSFDNSVDANIVGGEMLFRFQLNKVFGMLSHSVLIDSDVKDKNLNVVLATTNNDNINGYSDNLTKLDINYSFYQKTNLNANFVLDWGKSGVLRRNGLNADAANIAAHDRRLGAWNTGYTGKRYFLNLTLSVRDVITPDLDLLIAGNNMLNEISPDYNNSGYLEQGAIGRSVFASLIKRF